MSKTFCDSCNEVLYDGEIFYAFETPYCEDCFSSRFVYCHACDTLLHNEDAYQDTNGEFFCDLCYDDGCPENPDVSDTDREEIITLSRNFLAGKVDFRSKIKISAKDEFLPSIRDKVGSVEKPIYVYGLRDRDEFHIMTTEDLIDEVREFVMLNDPDVIVQLECGEKRLGVSRSLRKHKMKMVVNLIKEITSIKVLETA